MKSEGSMIALMLNGKASETPLLWVIRGMRSAC